MTFRLINGNDDAVMAEIIRRNLRKNKLDIPGTAYYDAGLDKLSEMYAGPDCNYYVVCDDDGRVVGGIGYAKLPFMKDTAELQKLYLDESVQGGGFAYEMIAYIEERMRDAGYRASYLETHDNLRAAIHIYEKSGYRDIDKPKEIVHSAMTRFMKKELTE